MIDYIKLLLGKEPGALSYADIEEYFKTERIESDSIEFKSFNPGEHENTAIDLLCRAICGFLNSDGGIVIWGAPKETKIGIKRQCVLPLSPVNKEHNKDSLVSTFCDSIISMPVG